MSIESLVKRAQGGEDPKTIISQALSSPQIYTFGELLDVPAVANAGVPAQQLQIFAYGTWRDYQKAGLPALDDVQKKKLKHLTIATLASHHSELAYDVLRAELEIDNLRELEDLVLDAIYQGLIEAKIDQQSQKVKIDFAMGRDVKDSDLARIQTVLSNWINRSNVLMKTIEDKIQIARSEIKVEQLHREEFEKRVKEVKENLRAVMEAQEAEARAAGGGGMRRPGAGPGGMGVGMGMGMGMGMHGHQGAGGAGGRRGDPRMDPRGGQGGDPRDPRNKGGLKFGF